MDLLKLSRHRQFLQPLSGNRLLPLSTLDIIPLLCHLLLRLIAVCVHDSDCAKHTVAKVNIDGSIVKHVSGKLMAEVSTRIHELLVVFEARLDFEMVLVSTARLDDRNYRLVAWFKVSRGDKELPEAIGFSVRDRWSVAQRVSIEGHRPKVTILLDALNPLHLFGELLVLPLDGPLSYILDFVDLLLNLFDERVKNAAPG